MKTYEQLSAKERRAIYSELSLVYDNYRTRGLMLDLSRGKPNSSQLDVSNGLLNVDLAKSYNTRAGVDCRNYGLLDGLPEMKTFFADAMGLDENDITVGGNSYVRFARKSYDLRCLRLRKALVTGARAEMDMSLSGI